MAQNCPQLQVFTQIMRFMWPQYHPNSWVLFSPCSHFPSKHQTTKALLCCHTAAPQLRGAGLEEEISHCKWMHTVACLRLRQDKPPVTATQNLLEDRMQRSRSGNKKLSVTEGRWFPQAAPKHPWIKPTHVSHVHVSAGWRRSWCWSKDHRSQPSTRHLQKVTTEQPCLSCWRAQPGSSSNRDFMEVTWWHCRSSVIQRCAAIYAFKHQPKW